MVDSPAAGDPEGRHTGRDTRHDVFVSFAPADSAWVRGYLLAAFDRAGVRYLSEADFPLGSVRLDELERAVRRCARVLLVLSPAYFSDAGATFLDLLAQSFGIESGTWPVIPIILRPVEALPTRIAMLTKLSAVDPSAWEDVLRRLCHDMARELPAETTPDCPYPGMVPYGEADKGRFFGREAEIDDLAGRVRLQSFLTVIGPSGSGKSSLVHAGVVPALKGRRDGRPERWRIRTLRPGLSPLDALADAFDGADPVPRAREWTRENAPHGRLLVVVDQLEELFTVARAGSDAFQRALLLLSTVRGCTVLNTVRADFYPHLMASSLWPAVQRPGGRIELVAVSGEALRRAITRPAENVGVYAEAALVERLVADGVGEPGALPLMQETLVLLWARLQRRLLPMAAYDALIVPRSGYAGGLGTGLHVAMARRADGAMASMADSEAVLARRIMLRLVQFGEGRPDSRRQQSTTALRSVGDDDEVFARVLARLVENRLVTLSWNERQRQQTADLSHEALIVGWPVFQVWITDRREAERQRRMFVDKAADWARLGHGTGGLLDAVELAEATRWLDGGDAAELGIDADAVSLVEASQAALDAARAQRDDADRREIQAAHDLTEAERKRADAERRRVRSLRRLVAALGAAVAVTVTVGILALLARHTATHQRDVARGGELSLAARALADTDLDAAILMSQVAARLAPESQTRSSVLAALEAQPALLRYLQGETGPVGWLAASRDGHLVAAGGDSGRALVWNTATGRQVGPAFIPGSQIRGVAFNPAGRLLAVGGSDGTVRIWDLTTGKRLGPDLSAGTGGLRTVAWSPDGRRLAAGGSGRDVIWWDTATWRPVRTVNSLSGWVQAVAFSPDGTRLAVGVGTSTRADDPDGELVLLDVATGRRVAAPVPPGSPTIRAVAFNPTGTLLATAGEDGAVRTFDARSGRRVAVLTGHVGIAYGVAFTPGGTLVSVGGDHTVRVWNARGGHQTAAPLVAGTDPVDAVVTLSDGTVVTSTDGHEVMEWTLRPRPRLAGPVAGQQPPDTVHAVAYSPDGRILATGSYQRLIFLRDGRTGRPTGRRPLTAASPVLALAFSPDGRNIYSATYTGTIRRWDVDSGTPRTRESYTGRGAAYDIAANPRGATVATADGDGTVRQWDAQTLRPVGDILSGDGSPVMKLAYSPDGRRLATVTADGVIAVWHLDRGPPTIERLATHVGQLSGLAFSPDGKRLAVGTRDGLVETWPSGHPSTRPDAQLTAPGGVQAVAFGPDNRTIASASDDGGVALWDLRGTRLVLLGSPLRQGNRPVLAVAFRPDAGAVAAGGDGVVVWDVAEASWRRRGCAIAGRNPSPEELAAWLPSSSSRRAVCPGRPVATTGTGHGRG